MAIDQEDQECTPEDCEKCEIYDDCCDKDEVFDKAFIKDKSDNNIDEGSIESLYDVAGGVNNEETIKQLVEDTVYKKTFLNSMNTNTKLLDIVLRAYLYAVFDNNVRVTEDEVN